MQTERVTDPIENVRDGTPFLIKPRAWLLALAYLWAMSASAITRIESAPIGIPGSGGALGSSVALSGDTAAVGAPGAQPTPLIGTGSVDIYRHAGADWQREAVLLPSDPVDGMLFGSQVALATDLLVTTAPGLFGPAAAVYTFARTGSDWQQVDRFEASGSVSLSGDTLALGNGTVYVRAGNGWAEQAQLSAEDGEVFNSTIVDGDGALAWASAYISNFEVHNYMYFFHRAGTAWTREARIELGDSSVFAQVPSVFALSGASALVSWNNLVIPYIRDVDGHWSSQGVLDPLTSAPGFGTSVALDGERALVSSTADTVFGWAAAGTVYVFERSNGIWTREAHVAHTTVNYYNYVFGTSLALDGDTMLVGAPGAYTDAGATGDATVLTDSGGDWTAVATLDAGNDHRGEAFGDAVALSGSTLLVGATSAPTIEPYVTGAAYVFDATGAGWVERVLLRPSEPFSHYFGAAVALDQDTAVVGAPVDDGGAVYVYVRGDGTWPQQARLVGAGTADVPTGFGSSVAIHGDVLAASEPVSSTPPTAGLVRVFERSGTVWSPETVLQAADGSVSDGFGSALALVGNTLVAGAPGADVGIETDGGAVYVFTNSGGVWSQQAKITAPVAAKLAGFGRSVALSGATLVVGAVDAGSTRGAAYVYTLGGGVWTLQDRLLPDGSISGSYGAAVAISESAERIVVGQPVGSIVAPNGRAFVFDHTDSGWSPLSPVAGTTAPPALFGGDAFGKSLAMSGETVAIGAPRDGRGGAAYIADVGEVIFDNGFEGD